MAKVSCRRQAEICVKSQVEYLALIDLAKRNGGFSKKTLDELKGNTVTISARLFLVFKNLLANLSKLCVNSCVKIFPKSAKITQNR